MEKQTIDYNDLISELKNPPNIVRDDFDNWYQKNLDKFLEIKRTKNGFKILVVILSAILFILSFFLAHHDTWLRIFQVLSFALMLGVWLFVKQETKNPDIELLIMRLINKYELAPNKPTDNEY